ncbi:MAG: hypothetical protein Q4G70_10045 [Pseudomonadota bacterium]|nr:hypothetical protein [Pseudomonadota bacterium]
MTPLRGMISLHVDEQMTGFVMSSSTPRSGKVIERSEVISRRSGTDCP